MRIFKRKTLDLLKEVGSDLVNRSKFGARPGTEAYLMPHLDPSVISSRSRVLHKFVRRLMSDANSKWLGWRGRVFVDEETEKGVVSRNLSYKPIAMKTRMPVGRTLDVRVVGNSEVCLIGEPVILR